jgi:hypothetical protein
MGPGQTRPHLFEAAREKKSFTAKDAKDVMGDYLSGTRPSARPIGTVTAPFPLTFRARRKICGRDAGYAL